jgi:CTP synthase
MVCSGVNPERDLVEIIELPDHPFFIAGQFHPELKSRPMNPHPLFVGLVEAAIKFKVRKPLPRDIEKTLK